jgi:hypothetical protein
MIGVLAKTADHAVVAEFFELFKTPWEFYHADRQYSVVLCDGEKIRGLTAKLVLVYGGRETPFDSEKQIGITARLSNAVLSYQQRRLPIYGNCLTFRSAATEALLQEETRQPAICEVRTGDRTWVRLGYDLFQEIRQLLTRGQPVKFAGIPTLEIHIALLRDLILGNGLPLVEIPPVPQAASFIACLTHDVDHAGIRNHLGDHTMFGFLYRATAGSLINFLRGRTSLKQLVMNLWAAFRLPFVYLGLAKDFWFQFEHYQEIENGTPSTFFVIPRKDDPGINSEGRSEAKRAAKYDLAEVAPLLRPLHATGHEIGVHGIDAWRDSVKGREERERVAALTGTIETGIRMHWLYFGEQSPVILESAGFSYDSTVGYNETVGYRAGTTQVFKPLETVTLLELPMHIMDTSLFYPSYLNLSPAAAAAAIEPMVKNAVQFGGVLTVNWHDRSIAPERLWDQFYIKLLGNLKRNGARFLTAARTTAWFRMRRSAVFENVSWEKGMVNIKAALKSEAGLPGLKIRIHKPRGASKSQPSESESSWIDVAFDADLETQIAI